MQARICYVKTNIIRIYITKVQIKFSDYDLTVCEDITWVYRQTLSKTILAICALTIGDNHPNFLTHTPATAIVYDKYNPQNSALTNSWDVISVLLLLVLLNAIYTAVNLFDAEVSEKEWVEIWIAHMTWCCHVMEMLSALLVHLCGESADHRWNSPVKSCRDLAFSLLSAWTSCWKTVELSVI